MRPHPFGAALRVLYREMFRAGQPRCGPSGGNATPAALAPTTSVWSFPKLISSRALEGISIEWPRGRLCQSDAISVRGGELSYPSVITLRFTCELHANCFERSASLIHFRYYNGESTGPRILLVMEELNVRACDVAPLDQALHGAIIRLPVEKLGIELLRKVRFVPKIDRHKYVALGAWQRR